jgi:hypothetical protein
MQEIIRTALFLKVTYAICVQGHVDPYHAVHAQGGSEALAVGGLGLFDVSQQEDPLRTC